MKSPLFITLLLVTTIAFAQERKVLGRVIDQATNKPVKGANISIDGSEKKAVSNFIGYFELVVDDQKDKTISVSHVAYAIVNAEIPKTDKFQFSLQQKYLGLHTVYLNEYPKKLGDIKIIYPQDPAQLDEFVASPPEGFDRFYALLGNALQQAPGKNTINFTIDVTGKAADIVLAEPNTGQSAIVIRTLENMPAWLPSQQNGVKVPLNFVIGIMPGGRKELIETIYKQLRGKTVYPLKARRMGSEGFVDIMFSIDDNGNAIDFVTISDLIIGSAEDLQREIKLLPKEELISLVRLSGMNRFLLSTGYGLGSQAMRAFEPVVYGTYSLPILYITAH